MSGRDQGSLRSCQGSPACRSWAAAEFLCGLCQQDVYVACLEYGWSFRRDGVLCGRLRGGCSPFDTIYACWLFSASVRAGVC